MYDSTPAALPEKYRERIYGAYVEARQRSLIPTTVAGFAPMLPQLRKLIRLHFPRNPDARILELGCGPGVLIYCARKAGYTDISGVDGSAPQVAEATRLGIEGVRLGDLMLTLRESRDTSYDAVVTLDVIEHFRKEEIIDLVDEVQRVLKPGGRWLIRTPNGESPFGSRMRYWDFTHETAFTRESITQLLKSSGLNAVRCFEDGPVPHGLRSAVRWALWKVISSGFRFCVLVETGTAGGIFTQNLLVVATR